MGLWCKGWGGATVIFVLGFSLGGVCFSGCGRGETAVKPAKSGDDQPSKSRSRSSQDRAKPVNQARATGRKEVNGIPYDVFFDDPLAIAANTQSLTPATSPPGVTAPSTPPPAPSDPPESTLTDGPDWAQIIPKQQLEAEVKRIRNRLTQYLQSVGNYNQNIFQIPSDTATLAMLAGIAGAHSDAVSWKQNAKYVRDLAAKMLENDMVQGRKSFEAVEGPFLSIVDVLNGNIPADLAEAEDSVPFADVAEFGHLMKRLERMEKWVKANAGSEDAFKQNGELAMSEAHLAAAIAKVIVSEGYGFADDDDFKGYALPMSEAALKMASAVNGDNFAAFDEGMNALSQMCTQCHGAYRD